MALTTPLDTLVKAYPQITVGGTDYALRGLVPMDFDTITMTYSNGALATVLYKKSGTTIATLTLTWSGGNLSSVVRT